MPTELILIRHGESHANVEPTIGGMTGDIGLTDRGRGQAARLRSRLAAEGFRADVLYASTLPRAQETAAYVAEAIGLPVTDDDELQELRPGVADGWSFAQWEATWPYPGEVLHRHPYVPMAEGGESWASFVVRAGAGLARLVERHPDRRVVAVCHGGVIEASFYLALGLGASGKRVGFAVENTSLTHWRYTVDDALPEWTLNRFNDVAHLEADEPDADRPAVPIPGAEDEQPG